MKDHWQDLVLSALLALGMFAVAVGLAWLAWRFGIWVTA